MGKPGLRPEMVARLTTADGDFAERLNAFLAARQSDDSNVDGVVASIIADVRKRGDDAVVEYTARFDRLSLTPATMRLGAADVAKAEAEAAPKAAAALKLAAERISAYHKALLPKDLSW